MMKSRKEESCSNVSKAKIYSKGGDNMNVSTLKKTLNFHKKLSIMTVVMVSFALLFLMGAGELTSFSDIATDVEELSFGYIQFSDDYEEESMLKNVRIQKGEPHFDELLKIISNYTFEQTDGFKFAGKNGVRCEVDPTYLLTIKTYNKYSLKISNITVADTGELNVNMYNYDMASASELIDELIAYVMEHSLFS